jgi:hypothetical protein
VILNPMLRAAFLLLLSLLTVNCASNAATAPSASAAPASEIAVCRADNFTAFLERFSDDPDFQKRSTASPLRQRVVEDALPEPKLVEKTVELSQLRFPIFPGSARIKAESLQMQLTPDGRGMKVRLSKPDTDYRIEYFFEHRECWQLVRLQDSSL